jgi:hypothetical protein
MSQTDSFSLRPKLDRLQQTGLVIGLVGLALSLAGAFLSREQFWQSYLVAYIFWLQIALGSLAILMVHHLTGGRWGFLIRRILESGAMTLPWLALLAVPFLFGLDKLYIWTNPDLVAASEPLLHKSVYLNIPFFVSRAVVYFIIWTGLAYLLNRWSLSQDRTAEPALTGWMRRLSGPGLILYVLTATFAAYDWLMSLEPAWFSSIYGVLFITGQALATLAFAIIVVRRVLWSNHPSLLEETSLAWADHFNDLGNLLLGFVMMWAYISFSQYLIIWSANIPEEAIWYYHRSRGGWQWVGLGLILFHFVLPFLLLLSRRAKRKARLLAGLASLIIVMRLVELFWLVAPAFHPQGLYLHWLDVVAPLTLGGFWLTLFFRQLAGKPLLAATGPRWPEVLDHE